MNLKTTNRTVVVRKLEKPRTTQTTKSKKKLVHFHNRQTQKVHKINTKHVHHENPTYFRD